MPKRSLLPVLLVVMVALSSARSPPLVVPTLEKAVATPTLLDFSSLENKYDRTELSPRAVSPDARPQSLLDDRAKIGTERES